MSDNEDLSSDSSSQGSEIVSNSDEEGAGAYFVFNGDFAPYQEEPLAANGGNMDGAEEEEEDEDSILPSVLEQRFEGQVAVDNW